MWNLVYVDPSCRALHPGVETTRLSNRPFDSLLPSVQRRNLQRVNAINVSSVEGRHIRTSRMKTPAVEFPVPPGQNQSLRTRSHILQSVKADGDSDSGSWWSYVPQNSLPAHSLMGGPSQLPQQLDCRLAELPYVRRNLPIQS
jgi:hypothetical protein